MNTRKSKTAIVTGASTGIGKATAETLARSGYTVFGTSRRAIENSPKPITMLKCDVTDDASVKNLVSTVLARGGHIDLLVNNAGTGLFGGAEESSIKQVRALFDVNLFGVMRMTNAVLPSMRQAGKGRILNVSSVLGFLPALYAIWFRIRPPKKVRRDCGHDSSRASSRLVAGDGSVARHESGSSQ